MTETFEASLTIKLPADFTVSSLKRLREMVEQIEQSEFRGFDALSTPKLEMTDEQYCDYKTLIFQANWIKYFDGHEIKLAPKKLVRDGDIVLAGNFSKEVRKECDKCGLFLDDSDFHDEAGNCTTT